MAILVFVFGTLKEGFPNFATNGGTWLPGVFVTYERFPLYLVGERHSPWLLNCPGQGERVLGQVFEVSAQTLERMDVLERVREPDGYERIGVRVAQQSSQHAASLTAFAYAKHPTPLTGTLIQAGPLAEYTLKHAV